MKNGQHGEAGCNCFQDDLQYSLTNNDDKTVNEFYYKHFPFLDKIEFVADITTQKQGIDKVLHFHGGSTINIDEKKRRKNYGDILLEEYSIWESKTAGWLGRSKHTDYITYIILSDNIIYLLPFKLLHMAWVKNYKSWLKKYGRKFTKNPTYTTSNIAVPKDVVFNAINKEMDIKI